MALVRTVVPAEIHHLGPANLRGVLQGLVLEPWVRPQLL